jgi:hypothetical protein
MRRKTLEAGFTTERDLGTEGADFADAELKQAIDQGVVPGPRLSVATKAIVARGAYGPKGFEPGLAIPQGEQEVTGVGGPLAQSVWRRVIVQLTMTASDRPRIQPWLTWRRSAALIHR